jgi:protein-L-isoaspartate(D-aspartate) O-methyltransferase
MVPIHTLLQRIRWGAEFGRAEFTIGYLDRVAHHLVTLPLARIELQLGNHFAFGAIEADGSRHEVPFHRVREVHRNSERIWHRETGPEAVTPPGRRRSGRLALVALFALWALVAPFALPAPAAPGADEFVAERRALSDEVSALARRTGDETGRPAFDARVMSVLAAVPRHRFVPPDQLRVAYQNRPLPIGHGQTISQPYIVALMTDLMQVRPHHVVLEIGTGSGYQAAVLAELAQTVCTIEIIEPLAQEATQRLRSLGYERVRTRARDGYYGWEDCGPFDSIIVTAAASHVPPPLVRQLKPGGRMVIPVGAPFLAQHLMLVEKRADGTIATRQILPVRFVPLTGQR